MARRVLPLVLVGLLWLPLVVHARGGAHSGRSDSGAHSPGPSGHSGSPRRKANPGAPPASHGRTKRSELAKQQFHQKHPCPSTGKSGGACPGYVVDHIVPLKRGGQDHPNNMQWQTVEAAKAKDKVE